MNHRTRDLEPFAQAGPATARKYGGTGLGLTISRELAHMLGGEITVESRSVVGSTFRLTVATGKLEYRGMVDRSSGDLAPLPSTATPLRDDLKLDCRILLVEDDPDSRRLISLLLERAGADMTVAENGQEANRIALDAWRDGRAFDVILMDICMPVLDGFAATRALRRQGYTNPIIALTAHTLGTSHDSCVAAGFDDLATKPIDCNALSKAILALVPAPAST
ncbi:MAG: response regulator [Planctomycetes bacterium]|nr:response regulator [Planctomycetota bacterium]